MQQLEYVSVVSSWPKWCRNLCKAHLSIWRPYLLIEGLNARNRILQWTLTLFVIISCISNSNSCNCAMCTEFILCIMWRFVNIVKMCEYCELIRASVSSEWHRECQADSTSPLNISKTGRDYNPRQLRRGLVPILKHLPLSPLGPDKFQFNKQHFIIRAPLLLSSTTISLGGQWDKLGNKQ